MLCWTNRPCECLRVRSGNSQVTCSDSMSGSLIWPQGWRASAPFARITLLSPTPNRFFARLRANGPQLEKERRFQNAPVLWMSLAVAWQLLGVVLCLVCAAFSLRTQKQFGATYSISHRIKLWRPQTLPTQIFLVDRAKKHVNKPSAPKILRGLFPGFPRKAPRTREETRIIDQ